ncbi:MAG: urea carboxylase-associated family protein [Janthinobacterium lividum]
MLLLKDPPVHAPLARSNVHVPAGESRAIEVRRGQILRIEACEAGAVAALFGFSPTQPDVFLSVHHTRVFSNSYLLQAGMRMVSNRRRALMVLGKDSSGRHDLLLPASTTAFLAAQGYAGQTGCVESVRRVVAECGLMPPKLPDPINLFMNVALHQDGRIEPLPNVTRAGDFIACRVVSDMVFIVSACCTGISGNDRPGALALSAAEELDAF